MKPVYVLICRRVVTHPNQWTISELRIEKGIHDNACFRQVHIGEYSNKGINFPTIKTPNMRKVVFKVSFIVRFDSVTVSHIHRFLHHIHLLFSYSFVRTD